MIKALKKKYALSNQGAKDLLKGIVYSVLANISLMFPVILLAIVLNQLLAPVFGNECARDQCRRLHCDWNCDFSRCIYFFIIASTPQHISERMTKAQGGVSDLRKNCAPLPLTFFHPA